MMVTLEDCGSENVVRPTQLESVAQPVKHSMSWAEELGLGGVDYYEVYNESPTNRAEQ